MLVFCAYLHVLVLTVGSQTWQPTLAAGPGSQPWQLALAVGPGSRPLAGLLFDLLLFDQLSRGLEGTGGVSLNR